MAQLIPRISESICGSSTLHEILTFWFYFKSLCICPICVTEQEVKGVCLISFPLLVWITRGKTDVSSFIYGVFPQGQSSLHGTVFLKPWHMYSLWPGRVSLRWTGRGFCLVAVPWSHSAQHLIWSSHTGFVMLGKCQPLPDSLSLFVSWDDYISILRLFSKYRTRQFFQKHKYGGVNY